MPPGTPHSAPARPAARHAFPGGALFACVDRIWSWELGADGPWPPALVLPGSGDELFLHLGAPFRVGLGGEPPAPVPRCHIMSLRSVPARIDLAGSVGFVCVRFRAGGLARFHRLPPALLTDSLADAREALGPGVETLAERVAEARSFAERAGLMEAWLLDALHAGRPGRRDVEWAVRRMYYHSADVRLDDLLARLGITARHLQRLVKETLGVGPKRHIRLSRFQRLARPAALGFRGLDLDAALAGGYFDQSHFIKDFREFAGMPPGDYLRGGLDMSHFYYPSRPDNVMLGSSVIHQKGGSR
ncbi:hypothetical protein NNJEOMEG_01866 [Fundidesulfovibrio magnetotacticus]|uniref:HTH araC/xylS-type domain-containing protein n=1 Tax=Fundidesulfovibrio magnetotacticus TaxID=2730080 RepID=A0A6V8LUN8_9BACT|nr:helix-turn-helix domain-containing protein [Fundidesulfovibrio magnetotacticus]GFK94028.1 hypothetical protein NNJEOMEG_01866 [Fundidesulfovibrio magnetotacticus]